MNYATKPELRKSALILRKNLFQKGIIQEKSLLIQKEIFNSDIFQNAHHIALYYPYNGEIDISPLLNCKNKVFYLPRTCGLDMDFVKYDSALKKGQFGIMEPAGETVDPRILDVIYIPSLLVNSKGYRLGYGKGFYDRFFKKNKELKAKKILISLSCFLSNDFCEESFDEKCDMIINEEFCKIC